VTAGRLTEGKSLWIWPFELTEKIGEGGMAVVYRARYVKDDRQVAVKLLPEATVVNPTLLARFQREMEVLKNLRHPNIVRCFGGVCENKQPFYAMELVEGGTLGDLLRNQGRRNWRTTAECGVQMCAALGCAHDAGVVHRDVKPSNFLIDGDQLKLSDFGLALMASGAKLTAAEKTVGTFDYMAPEQIGGKEVSPRTDLYALGCVFFEMLTGRPPFEAEERVAVLHEHLKTPPPRVADFVHDCPPDLDRLVDDLLAKDPEDRPRDAAAVAKRLQAILDGREVPVSTRARTRTSKTVRDDRPPVAGARGTATPERVPTAASADTASSSAQPKLIAGLALLVAILGLWLLSLRDMAVQQDRAVDRWTKFAASASPAQREQGIRALGVLASSSDEALEWVAERLDDSDATIRREAVAAMGAAGGPARPWMAQLVKIQKSDADPQVRMAADGSLRSLQDARDPGNSWWWRILGMLVFLGVVAYLARWPVLPFGLGRSVG
jgi:eukaryotic-like serine/threonine-protein kinase